MTPSTILYDAQADGVRLSLSPAGTIKATGDSAAVSRWLPTIREHKPEIVEALQRAGNDQSGTGTFYRWLVRFLDRDPLEVTFSPEASRAEVEGWYPEATGAEPVFDPPGDALPALSDAE